MKSARFAPKLSDRMSSTLNDQVLSIDVKSSARLLAKLATA